MNAQIQHETTPACKNIIAKLIDFYFIVLREFENNQPGRLRQVQYTMKVKTTLACKNITTKLIDFYFFFSREFKKGSTTGIAGIQ